MPNTTQPHHRSRLLMLAGLGAGLGAFYAARALIARKSRPQPSSVVIFKPLYEDPPPPAANASTPGAGEPLGMQPSAYLQGDKVAQASWESFPASDPPGWRN